MKRVMALALLLVACDAGNGSTVDQCIRREIFEECVKASEGRPGDYADVVNECDLAAIYQARRLQRHVQPECRQ